MNYTEGKYSLLLSGKKSHLIAAVNQIRSGKTKSFGKTVFPVRNKQKKEKRNQVNKSIL